MKERSIVGSRDVIAELAAEVDVTGHTHAIHLDHDGHAVAQEEVNDHHDGRRLLVCLGDLLAALDATFVDVVEVEAKLPLAVGHLFPDVRVGMHVHLLQAVVQGVHIDRKGRRCNLCHVAGLLQDVVEEVGQALGTLKHLFTDRLHDAQQQALHEEPVDLAARVVQDVVRACPEVLRVRTVAAAPHLVAGDIDAPRGEALKDAAVNHAHGAIDVGCVRLGVGRPPTLQRQLGPGLDAHLSLQNGGLSRHVHPQPPAGFLVAAHTGGLQLQLMSSAEAAVLGADLEVGHLDILFPCRIGVELLALRDHLKGLLSAPTNRHPEHLDSSHHCEQNSRSHHPRM
mmetsp:Transcript_161419/g.518298  ORF Transcript_161419/g.518298 Transcript_161419/m.518298 type:complete len:340 (-) Transcript_161419:1734-2753(-)